MRSLGHDEKRRLLRPLFRLRSPIEEEVRHCGRPTRVATDFVCADVLPGAI